MEKANALTSERPDPANLIAEAVHNVFGLCYLSD